MATTDEMLAEAAEGFFLAAEHGRSDVLKALADHAQGQLDLRQIVDPATGRTPLHVAVANGKTDAVRVLLAAGFPPDHESLPVGYTSASGNSNGTSTSDTSGKRQNTAYLLAKQLRASDLVFVFHQFTIQQIATNNAAGVKQMLDAGVDVDTTDGSAQNTFVHWAVTCSAAQVLELLLQREDVQQAKVMDRVNAEGAPPLHLACRVNNVECTRLLLRYGANRGVEGEKGVFKGKTAIEMATAQEVCDLFTAHSDSKLLHQLQQSEPSGSHSSSSPSPPPSSTSTAAESAGEDDNVSAATTSRRNSRRTSEQEMQSARLLVQLEEKDLLIVQLRKTIETLVIESQEIRKLGDERVVLDYVRKLREENAILQRNLEDAEEHIRIQQEQLQQLKSEIRKVVTVKHDATMESTETVTQDNHPPPHHRHFQHSEGPADSSFPAEKTQGPGADPLSRLPASPLRLDASGGERVKPNWSERPPLSSSSSTDSATWRKSVLGGLWPFGSSDDVQDMDGEVIMTV